MHDHYLVGLDFSNTGSEPSTYALEWVSQHFLAEGDRLTVATILPNIATEEIQEAEQAVIARAQALLEHMATTYSKKHIEADFKLIHSSQDTALALCEMAVDVKATNLVLGYDPYKKSHHMGNYCLDNSEVPVTVVRPVYHYK
ncbi:uncharacterized protein BJ171DRAFT_580012 [Polychytrium aggregatum]|uniref:uncharacterized protein n=1 Tax=Polychytrium aggregatum TaxID=110093 RepID=UPI0022FE81A4|nr:uncharacterized protein BJ171DRAFT_580012 [Polychytrium aggregatum]KAI9206520.1 hypothetical protein BJ171DRAFT_580012 [Polychytrium aggregatum]